MAEIAAEGARDARHAYNAANMYGYGSPYNRMPSGRIHSPLLGPPLMAPHPHSVYGTPLTHVSPLPLGIGISPHLDPAYTVGHLQARREMAIAEQRRRRMLQQRQILAVSHYMLSLHLSKTDAALLVSNDKLSMTWLCWP